MEADVSPYGKKGGTGATAGRKAEMIEAEIAGTLYRKRVFFGQRFLVVSQRANDPKPLVTAWHTEEEARYRDEEARRLGCEFHAWSAAAVKGG
jgi:hypothetical protein